MGNDILFGSDGNDSLNGGEGDDTLNGGSGNDTLVGGLGNDRYFVDSPSDLIVEATSGGIDTVESRVSFTLAATLENLLLTGTGAINGTGNSLNNFLLSDSASHNLNGAGGNDTLVGGEGNDTLTGGNGNDSLAGGAGNDLLRGGTGIDTLEGGAGNDTYDSFGDVIIEAADAGIDTVLSSISFTLGANLENLTLLGTGNLNGTGNSLSNTITGNGGNNILNGRVGNDTLVGGDGNDTYIIDSGADVAIEAADAGVDSVQASASVFLSANVENLTLLGTGNLGGTGNSLNNLLIGNSGNNNLNGADGNDTMQGGAGNDVLIGGAGNDILVGGLGNDLFLFNGTSRDVDTLRDFTQGSDRIGITQNAFGMSSLNQIAFVSTDAVVSTTGGILVYSTQSGILSFDSNSTASEGLQTLAQLSTGGSGFPVLTAADFQLLA